MDGGDLAILAIWVICLVVSLGVSALIGWRRPRRPENGAAEAPQARPPESPVIAPGAVAEGAAPVVANAPGAPRGVEEQRPPAA